ncbi:hypothetical protein [Duganella vulcania]|uniref:Uncharacterized protein n=1 Tax=Duganella vulcania TaxID=2692166 RepID=A0A845GSS0_9BURK|nr:hypothetical protein [Duganella vulcania]MYM96248.1 hypothetical protein [Duganella vulcania]
MDAAKCKPGLAVIVRAADEFYAYIDGWKATLADLSSQAGGVWIACPSPSTPAQQIGPELHFLVPPDQLELDEKTPED